MEIASYLIQWHEKFFESGWIVRSVGAAKQSEERKKYVRIKYFYDSFSTGINLKDLNSRTKFLNQLKKNSFIDEFEFFRPDIDFESIKVFYLELSSYWELPWELSLGEWPFNSLRKTVFLRVANYASLQSSVNIFNGKLRILVLEGSPGIDKTNLLNIRDETKAIKDAVENLPTETKDSIADLAVKPFIQEQLLDDLNSIMPHIIWFNGHGSTTNNSELLDYNNQWVSASDFTKMITQSRSRPNYIIFSACDTALAPLANRTNYVSPQLFQLLENKMPITILAMQSPIQSKTGIYIAQEIILSLRSGHSIELSFSEIRSRLKSICLSSSDTWRRSDWASPVLWTNKKFVKEIQWNVILSPLEQLQLLSVNKIIKTDESIIQREIFYEEIGPNYTDNIIPVWIKHKRLWFREENSKQAINLFYKIVNQLINRFGFAPLVIDLFSHSEGEEIKPPVSSQLQEGIRSWANSMTKKINIASSEKSTILKLIDAISATSDIKATWKELCSLDDIFLVIINPPLSDDPNSSWFWETVASSKNNNFIWCLSNEISTQKNNYWQVDNVIKQDFAANIDIALKEEPKLIKTLAIFDLEIRPDLIKELGLNNNDDFEKKDYWQSLFLTTPFGPLINATAKQKIYSHINEFEIVQLQSICAVLLKRKIETELNKMNVVLWEKLLFHSVQADLKDIANLVGVDLINYYYIGNMPVKLIAASKQVSFNALNDLSKLRIAWAHSQLFEIEKAEFFLENISDVNNDLDDFNKAIKFALLAENIKNKGGKNIQEKAYDNLDKAIDILSQINPHDDESLLKINRYQLKLRHDKIRILQYVNYDLDTAEKEYLNLLEQWRTDFDQRDINCAVIRRNLAECIRKKAEVDLKVTEIDFSTIDQLISKSEKYIDEALSECKEKYPESVFQVEILYEKAKLYSFKAKAALSQNGTSTTNHFLIEERNLLEEGVRIAKERSFHMMLAILRSRLFRRFQSFDASILEHLADDFDSYTHGWAIRSQLFLLEFGADHCFNTFTINKQKNVLEKSLEMTLRQTEIFKKYRYLSAGQSDKERIINTFCRLVTILAIEDRPPVYSKLEEIYSSYSFLGAMLDQPEHEICKANFIKVKK